MTRALGVFLVTLFAAGSAHARDPVPAGNPLALGARPQLHLTTDQALRFLDEVRLHPLELAARRTLRRLEKGPLGWQPILLLVPPPARVDAEPQLPMFALVARAQGRTFVSLTAPGSTLDPGDKLVVQRLLISDLLAGRRFSLTVYEDHALARSATRLVGVGARLTLRPALELLGWRMRVELLGSYDRDDGASAYFGLSGRLAPPRTVPSSPRMPSPRAAAGD